MALVPAVAGPIATLGGVVGALTSERGREIIRGLKRAGDWIRENNPGGRLHDDFHTPPKRVYRGSQSGGYSSIMYRRARRHYPVRRRRYTRARRGRRFKKARYYSNRNPTRRRLSRRQGARLPRSRYMVLRRFTQLDYKFGAPVGTSGYSPAYTDLNEANIVPQGDTITNYQKCRFDNCDSKRPVSIHAYLRNVRIIDRLEVGEKVVEAQPDQVLWTYHDQYRVAKMAAMNKDKLLSTGVKHQVTRKFKPFLSLFKTNLYCRANTTISVDNFADVKLRTLLNELQAYNKTGNTSDKSPNNMAYWIMPLAPSSDADASCSTWISADLCIATKWRLFGAEGDS